MKIEIHNVITVVSIFILIFGLIVPSQAQEGGFTETFNDPTLPGWERTDNAIVEGGILRIEGQGFAFNSMPIADATIAFRFMFEGDGYLEIHYSKTEASTFLLHLTTSDITILKEMEGQRFPLNATDIGFSPSQWNSIQIVQKGYQHSVFLEPGIELTAVDDQILPAGGLMLHNFGDAVVEFDDLSVIGDVGEGIEEEEPGEVEPTVEEESPKEGEEPEPQTPSQPSAQILPLSQLTWVRTGGPPGGLGYDIRYNFADPYIWYVTDFNAGVNISTDNGLTWQPSNTGILSEGVGGSERYPIFSLTVDPHNPQIVWAGTDLTGHIYKSTDGGLTWTKKDNGVTIEYEGLSFRGFTVHPQSSDIVYAMAETSLIGNNVWGSGVGGVIYKTVDGGEHWELLWDGGLPSSLARYMWINPQNPDVLYVSTGIFDRGAVNEGDPNVDPDPWGGLGILKSTDGGETWQVLNEDNGLDFLYVGSLYMHPDDPDILLAATGHVAGDPAFHSWTQQGHSPMGVYRTTDGGETWIQVLAPPLDAIATAFSSVEICPHHHDIVYAGSEHVVFRSEDGGITWQRTNGGSDGWGPPGVAAGWPIDMQCDPRDPNRIFANNYKGGNFLSEDGGVTWVNASTGYTGAQLIDVSIDPFNPARVIVAGRSGVWISEDAGNSWNGIHNPGETKALSGGEWGAVSFDPTSQNHILLGGPEHILEWDKSQQKWQRQPLVPDVGPEIVVIQFAPSNPSIVYAGAAVHNSMIHLGALEGGQGVMVSFDGGSNWQNISGTEFFTEAVLDLSIHPTNPQIVYVATPIGLFKTTDGGNHWSQLLEEKMIVRSVAINPDDPNRILMGIEEVGLFLSNDGGTSWKQVTAGLEPNGSHRDIIFDPTNANTVYLADLASGVYRSEDAGGTWIKIDNSMNVKSATRLSLSSDGLHLYAATAGGGVYRLDLNGQSPASTGLTLFGESAITEPQEGPEDEEPELPKTEEASPEEAPESEEEPSGISLPCLGNAMLSGIFLGLLWLWKKKLE